MSPGAIAIRTGVTQAEAGTDEPQVATWGKNSHMNFMCGPPVYKSVAQVTPRGRPLERVGVGPAGGKTWSKTQEFVLTRKGASATISQAVQERKAPAAHCCEATLGEVNTNSLRELAQIRMSVCRLFLVMKVHFFAFLSIARNAVAIGNTNRVPSADASGCRKCCVR
jgi:hypothetical protein